jgi:hypothetical protein
LGSFRSTFLLTSAGCFRDSAARTILLAAGAAVGELLADEARLVTLT